MLSLNVIQTQFPELDASLIAKLSTAINEAAPSWLQNGIINVKLVDDSEIKALNSKYSGNDYATDVLSFSYIEAGEPLEGELGDIVVSVETAKRQAEEGGLTLAEELANLVMHGILHIFGFDHKGEAEQKQMLVEHNKILKMTNFKLKEFIWTS